MTRPTPECAPLPLDLSKAFETLASDAVGEFGPTPLARLIATHIALFAELRRRGASWAQIAKLLAAHGIGRDGGFTADVVRATYARAINTARTAERERDTRNATKRSAVARNATMHAEPQRNPAGRNDTKPNGPASANVARRAALIDKPWHTR